MFEFADGVWGHAFGVFFLNLDLLDGYELGWVGTEVSKVDIGVCSLSEFPAYRSQYDE